MSGSTWRYVRRLTLLIGAIGLLSLPAGGIPEGRPVADGLLAHVSQAVGLRYWLQHPAEAPPSIRAALEVSGTGATGHEGRGPGPVEDIFNLDGSGTPQNEESVSVCRSNPRYVLGGTNDFRGGAADPFDPNGAGWHFSTDGGRTVANDGLLPEVDGLPSCCDPVDVFGSGCSTYASSLAFLDPFAGPNGIAVYKSDPQTLASCPGGTSDPSCWPTRRLVAEAEVDPATGVGHFLDKEWMDVGVSGAAGEVVWVAYADFLNDPNTELGFASAEIRAVRCDANLVTCTAPIDISVDPVGGPDTDVQFADVTIDADGRTYITWTEIVGEIPEEGDPFPFQTFIHKVRVAEPGSTTFGPERVIYEEPLAVPFGGFLHANDFRIATYPKNEVVMVDGDPRIFLVWEACRFRPDPFVCEEAEIKLLYSDDLGVTWRPTSPIVLSRGNENYFPTIGSNDRARDPIMAAVWFTNRRDPLFHNRQDVELVSIDPDRARVEDREIITDPSNEPEADPWLGGFFIGDYIEVAVNRRTAYVHYNANYRHQLFLGQGVPVPQQDNYLTRVRLEDDHDRRRRG
jgi:hypothetical protein